MSLSIGPWPEVDLWTPYLCGLPAWLSLFQVSQRYLSRIYRDWPLSHPLVVQVRTHFKPTKSNALCLYFSLRFHLKINWFGCLELLHCLIWSLEVIFNKSHNLIEVHVLVMQFLFQLCQASSCFCKGIFVKMSNSIVFFFYQVAWVP